MSIPDFQSIFLPLLKYLSIVESTTSKDCVNFLANEFLLTEDERKKLLPSGKQPIFNNRVGWAKTYLNKAGLLDVISRGVWSITESGKLVLENDKLMEINVKFLNQFEKFKAFHSPNLIKENDNINVSNEIYESQKTPKEILEDAYAEIRSNLAMEILQKVKKCTPEFFESIVVDLLLKMGYGGSRSDAGKAIGQTGDGGIDGIINEDRLGLDSIYIQAKRWDDTVVGQPEIQKFVGAMAGRQGDKGVFITTSTFSQNARKFASTVFGVKIRLIDGNELAQYMIDFDIGTSSEDSYILKRIDSDYFIED